MTRQHSLDLATEKRARETRDRNPSPHYGFRQENNYRISVAINGVKVRAWYYEVPQEERYGHETKVDPREVKPVGDVDQMIHLGLARVHSQMDASAGSTL